MIAHVAGIEHLQVELAPAAFVGLDFCGVKFVIQQAALAADEMGVKVVRLETVHDRGALAHLAAFEIQDRHAGGVVFVRTENFAFALGGEAGHALDFFPHEQQQRIQRVTAGREQSRAAIGLARVPAELAIPGSDAVIVIHLRVVQVAEQVPRPPAPWSRVN